MKQERIQRTVIIGIAAAALIVILGGMAYVQFMGDPLTYQYENAEKEVDKIASVQETAVSSVGDYYRAASQSEGVQPPSVSNIRSNVDALTDRTSKLGRQPGIFKNKELHEKFESYEKAVNSYASDVYDIADALEATESSNSVCSGVVLASMEVIDSTEARKLFKPCLDSVLDLDLSRVSDADYKALFITIRKVYNDYYKALETGEGIDASHSEINKLSVSAREVDSLVQQRLQERIVEMDLTCMNDYITNQISS